MKNSTLISNGLICALCVTCVLFSSPALAQTAGTGGTTATSTTDLSRNGIYGCNDTSAMSVGTLDAIKAVFVPVFDAAVTLNTGYLVYKECVLDGFASDLRENATANVLDEGLNAFNTGRDGQPMFPVDLAADIAERSKIIRENTLRSDLFSAINDSFEQAVVRATGESYRAKTDNPEAKKLTCDFNPDDLSAFLNNRPTQNGSRNTLRGLRAVTTNPACSPYTAYLTAKDIEDTRENAAIDEMLFRLQTSNGVYGVEEFNPDTGTFITHTPGDFVAKNVQDLIGTGLRQLENADEMDELVGTLFSDLPAHVISDSRGLAGITQSLNGQLSYLEQIVREAGRNVRNSAVRIALLSLNEALKTETAYHTAVVALGMSLIETNNKIRLAEQQCWEAIVPKTKEYAAQNGFQMTIATSTAFSNAVFISQIAPLATTTAANIKASETALDSINRIIADVQNSSSPEVQRSAILLLEKLQSQHLIHDRNDATNAESQRTATVTAMDTLFKNTISEWADSNDPNVSWCNYNNPAVIQRWAEEWRN